jgi:hypothetical protein
MRSTQTSAELATFRLFAAVCPLGIDLGSIEPRRPPEPDVACRLASGEDVAFELVEIIDRNWARLTSRMLVEREALRAMFDEATGDFRAALHATLHNALVYIEFENGARSRERSGAIPTILTALASMPTEYEGRWRPSADNPMRGVVRSISVSRGPWPGPEFDVAAVSSIGDPTAERIRAKCQKTYVTTRPVELLAFYELQPMTPQELWPAWIASLTETTWAAPFRRLWFFDVGSKAIPYSVGRPQPNIGLQPTAAGEMLSRRG